MTDNQFQNSSLNNSRRYEKENENNLKKRIGGTKMRKYTKTVLLIVITMFIIVASMTGTLLASETSLKIERVQPFTIDFEIKKNNPKDAAQTHYYVYRQKGTEIDISNATLISNPSVPSRVTLHFSNNKLDTKNPISEGKTYSYIVKYEIMDNQGQMIKSGLTNDVTVQIPFPNINLKIIASNGQVLANTPIEIRRGRLCEYGRTDATGQVGGFSLDDGKYDIIVRASGSRKIIAQKGQIEMKQNQLVNDVIELESLQK